MTTDNRTDGTFSQKQRAALEALAKGADYERASLAAGVVPRTLYRWRDEPLFRVELRRLSDVVLSDAAVQMKGRMGAAVGVLVEVMEDKDAPPSARVRAAVAMLETGLKILEAGELLARPERLEQSQGIQNATS